MCTCYERFLLKENFTYSGSGSFGLCFDYNGEADKYKLISICPDDNILQLSFNEGTTPIAETEIHLEPGKDYAFTYDMGEAIDFAIDVDVPDENIVNRMGGRRACLKCGATYHVEYAAPKADGVCDACGSGLVLRDDDKPETVQKRLTVYHDQTQPLIEYYKGQGVLHSVDGTQAMEAVFESITGILGA